MLYEGENKLEKRLAMVGHIHFTDSSILQLLKSQRYKRRLVELRAHLFDRDHD